LILIEGFKIKKREITLFYRIARESNSIVSFYNCKTQHLQVRMILLILYWIFGDDLFGLGDFSFRPRPVVRGRVRSVTLLLSFSFAVGVELADVGGDYLGVELRVVDDLGTTQLTGTDLPSPDVTAKEFLFVR
jgi:hypothetical protein